LFTKPVDNLSTKEDRMPRLRIVVAALAVALAAAGAAGASSKSSTLSVVAYSTPKTVFGKIIEAWQQTPDGKDVSFNQSYGPSTDQAKAVAAGLPADLVFLSWGGDVNLLVDAGLVDQNWDEQSYRGVEADTVVVFAVRNGNPKHIKGWADLIKPGVQVVTPNPFSSGSARWNVLAAYDAQRHLGKTDAQAQAYVQKLFTHVVSQDTSGRNATNTFLAGKGDVLLTYESEAITSRLAGQDIQYVIPRQTMLIELPIAVLKSSPSRDLANMFIQFTKGPVAQTLFAQYGWRPVNKAVAAKYKSKYPDRPGIFTIDDRTIGGYRTAEKRWFDVKTGIMARIEQAIGGPSAG
jgi:sulfate transport system substrate-binding protein